MTLTTDPQYVSAIKDVCLRNHCQGNSHIYSNIFYLFIFERCAHNVKLELEELVIMSLIKWNDEWHLLLQTIKQQDFEHVLEKSHRRDLLLTVQCVAITSIGTTVGGLVGGPLGALAGATTATMISYGANIRYKSLYELIKQLSSEEKYQLLVKVKAVLGGIFNEQTIILSAVVVAKEIFRFFSEMKGALNDVTDLLSSSNNFMIIEDINE